MIYFRSCTEMLIVSSFDISKKLAWLPCRIAKNLCSELKKKQLWLD